ncbi:hypothetical protein JYQ62_29395 [Nostoc sp. UHCC 0702]|nr:hypothetical protein JYQ62_29395 [Nostoc sp. UHCC 0702]
MKQSPSWLVARWGTAPNRRAGGRRQAEGRNFSYDELVLRSVPYLLANCCKYLSGHDIKILFICNGMRSLKNQHFKE